MFKERIKTHHSAMSEGKQYIVGSKTVSEVLGTPNLQDEKNATIYIHVPFCRKICSFCNMRRSLQNPSEDYASLIQREIKEYAALPYSQTTTFDAVYFGGGTPTTLSGEELSAIVRTLKSNFTFTKDAEFTIETTVTELTEEKSGQLIAAGVNRFSVGVQTFDEEGRRKMGRIGTGETAFHRLRQLKSNPDVTVSMDLIYNYPGQTMQSLYQDLDSILELELDGFSMYSLINMKEASIGEAQEETNDERMFFAIAEYMEQAGYHFLELTKMVKTDRYRYIMNRHQGADTLPLGAGAGGFINHLAMMNPIKLEEYKKSVEFFQDRKGMLFLHEHRHVTQFKGAVQMGRLPKETYYKDRIGYEQFKNKLLDNEMIYKEKENYLFTKKGIFWGNTISRELCAFL